MAVKIGQFILHAPENGKIWINTVDGEGGQFTVAKLEAMLAQFWKEEF